MLISNTSAQVELIEFQYMFYVEHYAVYIVMPYYNFFIFFACSIHDSERSALAPKWSTLEGILIYDFELKLWHLEVFPEKPRGLRPRTMWGGGHAHINVMTKVVSAFIVLAIFPGSIHRFAVVHTEKLPFQCIPLQS